jgi:hypothetical protein
VVAAVIVGNTAGDSPQAVLDGLRAGLVVPLVGAVIGAVLTMAGLRRRAPRAA